MRHRRLTPQQQIALMMTEDFGSNLGQSPTVHAARIPDDPPIAAVQVQDGVSKQHDTQMRCCSAGSCCNNIDGRACGLAVIEINEHGGCADYEPSQEEDDDDDRDHETIVGISAMMPAEVDHPSSIGNVLGRFNPGSML